MAAGGGFLTDGDAPSAQLQVKLGDQVKTGEVKKNNLHPGNHHLKLKPEKWKAEAFYNLKSRTLKRNRDFVIFIL